MSQEVNIEFYFPSTDWLIEDSALKTSPALLNCKKGYFLWFITSSEHYQQSRGFKYYFACFLFIYKLNLNAIQILYLILLKFRPIELNVFNIRTLSKLRHINVSKCKISSNWDHMIGRQFCYRKILLNFQVYYLSVPP